jgi:hypothetical protein
LCDRCYAILDRSKETHVPGKPAAKKATAKPATRKAAAPAATKPSARKAAATPAASRGISNKGPVLLSGGNPQIAKADGDAPVQAYIAAMPGWKSEMGHRLDSLIERAVPKVRKAVRWNSPFYGVEGNGWFLGIHCFTKYVQVTFLNGTSLKPMPPKGSKHPNVRYLDILEDEVFDEKQFTAWVKQASKLPGDPLF